jgi:hypothetical protein
MTFSSGSIGWIAMRFTEIEMREFAITISAVATIPDPHFAKALFQVFFFDRFWRSVPGCDANGIAEPFELDDFPGGVKPGPILAVNRDVFDRSGLGMPNSQ